MEVEIIPRFDYSQLAPASRILVEQRVAELHTQEGRFKEYTRQTVETAWAMGQALFDIQEHTQKGQFLEIIKREFPHWSQRTTYNYINLYKSLDVCNVANLDIGLKALYLISSPAVPEEARQEVIEQAQNGKVTYQEAKDTVKARIPKPTHKSPSKPSVTVESQVSPQDDYDQSGGYDPITDEPVKLVKGFTKDQLVEMLGEFDDFKTCPYCGK